jgi:hypothetical protein
MTDASRTFAPGILTGATFPLTPDLRHPWNYLNSFMNVKHLKKVVFSPIHGIAFMPVLQEKRNATIANAADDPQEKTVERLGRESLRTNLIHIIM